MRHTVACSVSSPGVRRTVQEQPVFDPDTTDLSFSHEVLDGFARLGQVFHGVERHCHDIREGYLDMLILSRPGSRVHSREMVMVRRASIDSVA